MTKLIVPQWPMPGSVAACSSTRIGGVSLPPYDSLNLGAHCGDNLQDVEENRRRMFAAGALPSYPVWLEQVHGTEVLTLDGGPYPSKRADASYSRTPGTVCAVMTADCLPVLFCNRDGTEVAAAHAGWRGLCEGVLEATVARFADKAENIRQRLANVGVEQIFGGDRCTLSEKDDFFSYRRDKTTGRMASFIWLI
ncbi:MAG: laccase domain-containing protein [Klebsiella pneumoniae]|nr:laccase domain-containing protein [Klebsiella pneumoniae]